MNLREELPGDEQTVRDIHRRAFGDHGIAVADLVDTLRGTITTDSGLSLVAEHAGQIVGHIMFTRCLLDAPRRLVDVQVLSPLAVAPEYQKQGIGSALIREGLEIMARQQVPLVFLEGDPGYYSRFGFLPGGVQGFRKPSPARTVDDRDAGLLRPVLAPRRGRPTRPERVDGTRRPLGSLRP
jgi:putative acetyltransferase